MSDAEIAALKAANLDASDAEMARTTSLPTSARRESSPTRYWRWLTARSARTDARSRLTRSGTARR